LYRVLADLVVLLHLAFILFVAVGSVLVVRWWRLALLHLPAVIWGATIELAGWLCPLTHLENYLRRAGGEAGYRGGFVDVYVVPVVYPEALTRGMQLALGVAILIINGGVYAWIVARRRRIYPDHERGSDRLDRHRDVEGRR
jgi:hypothetical protein